MHAKLRGDLIQSRRNQFEYEQIESTKAEKNEKDAAKAHSGRHSGRTNYNSSDCRYFDGSV